MRCTNCENENKPDAVFCVKCGARLMPDAEATGLKRKTGRKRVILIAAAVLAVMVIAVVAGVLVLSGSPARRLAQQLDLGNRYLSEMEYEQAIAAFEQALEIDPKSAEAYAGLIGAYGGSDDLDGVVRSYEAAQAALDAQEGEALAQTLLETGIALAERRMEAEDYRGAKAALETLQNVTLPQAEKARAETFAASVAEEIREGLKEPVELSALPEGLEDFLTHFSYYSFGSEVNREYDCRNATDAEWNILDGIITHQPYNCIDSSLYPLWQSEYLIDVQAEGADPLDRFEWFYSKFDAAGVDWILTHVFNCTEEMIPVLREGASDTYLHEGVYYRSDGGVGGPHWQICSLSSATFDGEYYEIKYAVFWTDGYEETLKSYYKARLSYKTTDDFSHWSLYENRAISAEEAYPEVTLSTEETRALFAQMPEGFTFTSGVGAWSTWLRIYEDGTFNGNYHDTDMGDYTYYTCDFNGRFHNVRRLNEYVYAMELAELNLKEKPGHESAEDLGDDVWMTRITSEPYGIQGGKTFMLYLPGARVAELPEAYVDWVRMPLGWYDYGNYNQYGTPIPLELPFCGLYNVEEQNGFLSSSD